MAEHHEYPMELDLDAAIEYARQEGLPSLEWLDLNKDEIEALARELGGTLYISFDRQCSEGRSIHVLWLQIQGVHLDQHRHDIVVARFGELAGRGGGAPWAGVFDHAANVVDGFVESVGCEYRWKLANSDGNGGVG